MSINVLIVPECKRLQSMAHVCTIDGGGPCYSSLLAVYFLSQPLDLQCDEFKGQKERKKTEE